MRRLVRGLCAAVALCLGMGGVSFAEDSGGSLRGSSNRMAAASPSQPGRTTSAARSAPPEWFAREGAEYVRRKGAAEFKDAKNDDVASFNVGAPVEVYLFKESGSESGLNIEPSNYWIAPVYKGTEPVGTLAAEFSGGRPDGATITDLPDFAKVVVNLGTGQRIVVDPRVKGWYLVSESQMVTPLDRRAREVLAGTVSFADFETIRRTLLNASEEPGSDPTTSATDEAANSGFLRTGLLAVMVLLLVIGVVVWLRYDSAKREVSDSSQAGGEDEPDSEHRDGPRTILTETGEMVRIYERPTRSEKQEEREPKERRKP